MTLNRSKPPPRWHEMGLVRPSRIIGGKITRLKEDEFWEFFKCDDIQTTGKTREEALGKAWDMAEADAAPFVQEALADTAK